jgi:inositol-hexakisphosphate/diphosphoinositol-pentakisphosphate 1-kinase
MEIENASSVAGNLTLSMKE